MKPNPRSAFHIFSVPAAIYFPFFSPSSTRRRMAFLIDNLNRKLSVIKTPCAATATNATGPR
jgi:hypothetical protein